MTAAQTVPPIITLTTDFGTVDHYAGTMKGVITSICPDARIIDITHDIPHFNIWSGAYAISQTAPFFPERTIHVVVVNRGLERPGGRSLAPSEGKSSSRRITVS